MDTIIFFFVVIGVLTCWNFVYDFLVRVGKNIKRAYIEWKDSKTKICSNVWETEPASRETDGWWTTISCSLCNAWHCQRASTKEINARIAHDIECGEEV